LFEGGSLKHIIAYGLHKILRAVTVEKRTAEPTHPAKSQIIHGMKYNAVQNNTASGKTLQEIFERERGCAKCTKGISV